MTTTQKFPPLAVVRGRGITAGHARRGGGGSIAGGAGEGMPAEARLLLQGRGANRLAFVVFLLHKCIDNVTRNRNKIIKHNVS